MALRSCEGGDRAERSEEHTSELQSLTNLVCRLLLEKKKSFSRRAGSANVPSLLPDHLRRRRSARRRKANSGYGERIIAARSPRSLSTFFFKMTAPRRFSLFPLTTALRT